jgi:hypothetical protein
MGAVCEHAQELIATLQIIWNLHRLAKSPKGRIGELF